MDRNEEQGPIRVDVVDEGAIWQVWLAAPKANILDTAMVESLTATFSQARENREVKTICIEGQGHHFSFGASVQEHLPDQVEAMLGSFHGLFKTMLETDIPTLAVVRGQCLGGGLELASFCQRSFAAPDAMLGQPEIKLGVFAPVASVLLRHRIGLPAAEDLCLTGRSINAAEAAELGLVDHIAEDPTSAALEYARSHFLPLSASSLRHAVRAIRGPWGERFTAELERAERRYLDELMRTHDAPEGIQSFLERRAPQWRNA